MDISPLESLANPLHPIYGKLEREMQTCEPILRENDRPVQLPHPVQQPLALEETKEEKREVEQARASTGLPTSEPHTKVLLARAYQIGKHLRPQRVLDENMEVDLLASRILRSPVP